MGLTVWAKLTFKVHCLQDAVARTAKFVLMFKRPGQRVMINVKGDLICAPLVCRGQPAAHPGRWANETDAGLLHGHTAACWAELYLRLSGQCAVVLIVHAVHCLTAMPCDSCLQRDLMSTRKRFRLQSKLLHCWQDLAAGATSACRVLSEYSICDAEALVPLLALQVTVCRTTC